MKSAVEALSKVDRIRKLSAHLQSDLLQISGKAFGHKPRFSMKLLVPVALVVGAGVLLAISPKTRNSLVVRTGVLLVTRYLKDLGERDDLPEPEDEQPGAQAGVQTAGQPDVQPEVRPKVQPKA